MFPPVCGPRGFQRSSLSRIRFAFSAPIHSNVDDFAEVFHHSTFYQSRDGAGGRIDTNN